MMRSKKKARHLVFDDFQGEEDKFHHRTLITWTEYWSRRHGP